MYRLLILLSLFLTFTEGGPVPSSSPEVKTNSGVVRGKTLTSPLGKELDVFLGIPYAQPPLGKLRFKPPLEVQQWEGIFNATEEPLTCYQKPVPLGKFHPEFRPLNPTTELSEDCLKLNVWVPKDKPEKAPVMVFIYGGGNARGAVASPMYDSSILSTEEKVIIFMMNYRVASLGFLFLNHPDVPGNAGLYDQLMALQWIKTNAEAFGGDPESITLFGQSSGAASVGAHLLSPLSRGLFNRAIMQSASPTAAWSFLEKDDAVDKAMTLVENLGCLHDRSNLTAIVHCLQTADPSDIIGSEIQQGYGLVFVYQPVADGKFFPEPPTKLIRTGQFSNVSLMTGTVKDEGSPFLLMYDPLTYSPLHEQLSTSREDLMDVFKFLNFDKLTSTMLYFMYLGGIPEAQEKSPKHLQASTNVVSDYVFTCPLTDFEVRYSKAGNDVFKYLFPHHSSVRLTPKWMGTIHGEELYYVFGVPLRHSSNYTKEEEVLSRRIMRYWGNFARTGNPNKSTLPDEKIVHWPRYTSDGKEYLVLAPNTTAVGQAYREKYCLFWRELRPELLRLLASEKENFKDTSVEDNQATD